MTTLIKLKSSLNTAIPGALANGEPAYTANGFRKLSMVANKVLQSNGTAVLYDDIDGGTF